MKYRNEEREKRRVYIQKNIIHYSSCIGSVLLRNRLPQTYQLKKHTQFNSLMVFVYQESKNSSTAFCDSGFLLVDINIFTELCSNLKA